MRIFIASDHAGFNLKKNLIQSLSEITFEDLGCFSETSVDYPDYAHLVAKSVSIDDSSIGILICGSGQGVCMTANKYQNIRASVCWNSEISKLARQHNNSNIICLPARFISQEESIEIINSFLNTSFEGGRHQNRVDKIPL
jgi:ribose 5-phosphate isomerase B